MKKSILSVLAIALVFSACKKAASTDPQPASGQNKTGYTGDDNLGTVPVSISVGTGASNLPSSADITSKFPPIGDQGQYGTCVAWAVGYNMKSTIEGIAKGYNASQLSSTANQMSPRDLFTAIPDASKGAGCDGTNFTTALDLVQSRGVATLQSVPYTSMGDCANSNVQSSWTSSAGSHKIKSYRKIDASVNTIKTYISQNIPVAFGAKLADNFMTWNSDNVLSSNTTYTQVGIHSYHALVIGGYDDSKGAGGAFKVVNTWGTGWGSHGYIWVDYNFFISEFCNDGSGSKPLFVADNDNSTTPDNNPPSNNTGVDLAAWIYSDVSNQVSYTNERKMYFNIYNIGSQPATASTNWSMYYIYYNAYDANDYGVITYDDFNSSIPANTVQQVNSNHAIFNYNIPAGGNLASTVFGAPSISRDYLFPVISGNYYLVMIADVDNKFTETNKMNNTFYTTSYPKYFQSGVASKGAANDNYFTFTNAKADTKDNLRLNEFNSGVTAKFPNAYRPDEIISFIKAKKASGDLAKKIAAYNAASTMQGTAAPVR